MWTPSRIVAVAAILFGVAGTISVVAVSGFTGASQPKLVTFAAAIGVGVGALAAPGRGDPGGARSVQAIPWMVAALALANVALAWIDVNRWAWTAPAYVPSINPIGVDFRLSYAAAQQFSTAPTSWPPFTVLLATPYLLLGPDAAYEVHVGILIALNIAALGFAASALRSRDGDGLPLYGLAAVDVGLLAPVFAVWLFLSYGFLFSLERGNYDAFPAFFAMLGLWSMVRRPAGVWLPTIAFSVAAAIKLYPAVLLLLVIWRFRRKSVLPLVACNVVLAFSAGPENLARFLSSIQGVIAVGSDWVGNSSAKSFSTWIDVLHPRYLPHLPVALLVAIPGLLLLITAWRLWRRHDHAATSLMLCAMVPVMFAVPSISHDYKLVLLAGPALVLTGLLVRQIGHSSVEPWWMLLTLSLLLFFVARPSALVWPAVLSNKYPWLLLFQILVAWMAWRLLLPAPMVPDTTSHRMSAGPAPLMANPSGERGESR